MSSIMIFFLIVCNANFEQFFLNSMGFLAYLFIYKICKTFDKGSHTGDFSIFFHIKPQIQLSMKLFESVLRLGESLILWLSDN